MYSIVPSLDNDPVSWRNLCEVSTLPKIDIFSWTVLHGKILTGDNLQKRGIEVLFIYSLCWVNSETIEHIFFFCEFAREVWDQFTIPWFGKVEFAGNVQILLINWEKNVYW